MRIGGIDSQFFEDFRKLLDRHHNLEADAISTLGSLDGQSTTRSIALIPEGDIKRLVWNSVCYLRSMKEPPLTVLFMERIWRVFGKGLFFIT